MGAVSGALFAELQCGDHAIFTRAKYFGTEDVTSDWLPRFGIQHDVFDAADLSQLEPLIKPNTKVIYVESPANPTMVLVDIAAVAEIAHRHGVKVFVDNTFATPYNTRPLELGADVVIHSLTKYMGGHGDILGGAETLVEQAAAMTHAMIPREVREAGGITDGMIRMSVGLEDPDDIIAGLDQTLAHV